jgi:hypothetical protein
MNIMLPSSPRPSCARPRDCIHRQKASLHSVPPSPLSLTPSRASYLSRVHGHRALGSMVSSSCTSLRSRGSLRSCSSLHSLVGEEPDGHARHAGHTHPVDHAQYLNLNDVVSPSLSARTGMELSLRTDLPSSLRLRPEHTRFLDELNRHGLEYVVSLNLHSHYDWTAGVEVEGEKGR